MARRPLSRPMFRVPGVSRQPAGILASSPQLIQAAQRNMMPPAMQPPGMMPINMPQPAPVQGPLTGAGVTPDMFGVQRRQVSAVTAPPAPVTPAALPPSYDATAVMDQVAGGLGSEVLPKPKPTPPLRPDDLGNVDERSSGTVDRMVGSFNRARQAADNILENVASREDKILAGKSINELYDEAFAAMDAETPTLSDYNLADFEDMAMKSLGYTEGRGPKQIADEDKKTSFWLSLIKAGLATAAGESPYALTNIARGLSFGVESFGKDLKDISATEREENRAIASAKLALLQDQRSVDVANRAAKIQAAQFRVQAAESMRGEQLAQANAEIDRALAFTQIENDLYKFVANQEQSWASLDFQKDKFEQQIKATIAGLQPEIIRGMLLVPGYVKAAEEGGTVDPMDPGSYVLTEDGEELFRTWVTNKGAVKLTDLTKAAEAASDTMVVDMLDFSHLGDSGSDMARKAQLQIGKLSLPSDPGARAAQLVQIARATGAASNAPAMIQHVIESGNLAGLTFLDKDGRELDVSSFDPDDSKDQRDLEEATSTIIFGRVPTRQLATQE